MTLPIRHFPAAQADLAGALVTHAGGRVVVVTGRLTHVDPERDEVRGHLSLLARNDLSLGRGEVRLAVGGTAYKLLLLREATPTDDGTRRWRFVGQKVNERLLAEVRALRVGASDPQA